VLAGRVPATHVFSSFLRGETWVGGRGVLRPVLAGFCTAMTLPVVTCDVIPLRHGTTGRKEPTEHMTWSDTFLAALKDNDVRLIS